MTKRRAEQLRRYAKEPALATGRAARKLSRFYGHQHGHIRGVKFRGGRVS